MKHLFFLLLLPILNFSISFSQVNEFTFIFMSDIHYHEKNNAPKALNMVIDTINAMKPDLVLVGGDIIYDVMRQTEVEAEELSQSFFKSIARLEAPTYYAIGNHEHFGLYDKEIDENHPLFGKKFYEMYFGDTYYSFDHKGWHFITLDNMEIKDRTYIGRVDSMQMEWLKTDLENVSDSTPIVIMAHVPLITTLSQYYGGGVRSNTNKLATENTNDILKLFKDKNLKLVLQGHVHYFEALNVLNKTMFISAPSVAGKWWLGKQHDIEEGFIRIDVKGDEFDYHYIDYGFVSPKQK
jgi:3',5'-cyclic AMP phosphodiesterase CpdA